MAVELAVAVAAAAAAAALAAAASAALTSAWNLLARWSIYHHLPPCWAV